MSTIHLRFFGSGVALDSRGQPVPMRSRKQLALLAYLATEHAIAHSRERLMALFWPEETTAVAQNNLRVTLSRLRELAGKLVVADTPAKELLISDRSTVQFNPVWIDSADINRFLRLLEQTRRHDHPLRNACDLCQAALRTAVALVQGAFLEGLGLEECPVFEEWLVMQRERLHLLVLEAYSDLTTFAEAKGDLTAGRDFAQHQIELDPLREPAYRQLMRILVKQGERSLALATFERCRTVLREELGLDPEVETFALHGLLLGEGEGRATSASGAPVRHRLPQQLTPFIGRERELAQLEARLSNPTYRLVSIVGPGGIGKSRLAQQVALQLLNRFADGLYFVPLAQVLMVESLPAAIAEAVGLTFAAGQQSPAEQLCEMIGSKQMLLVLDNFEHLIAGASLLLDLVRRSPRLVLLVTSRERLNLQAEDLFELQGLPTPVDVIDAEGASFAAVRLFVDRAHRLDKQFELRAEQLPHVVRICQLVEGFPLAIELAATWLGDLTCEEIVAELTTGLDRLETTLGDVEPQHRSLRAVFNSSWRLLATGERQTLAQLAIFRGGFNVDAARAVANASPSLLSSLRNKSLLRPAGSRRYDMHALVHQFSAEFLAASSFRENVRNAHCHYFINLLEEKTVALDTREAGLASKIIALDWENVMLAWQTAAAQVKLPLLRRALEGLVRFCDLRSLYQEIEMLLAAAMTAVDQAEASAPDATPCLELRCRLLTALAYFAECRHEYEQTVELSQRALTLAHQLNDEALIVGVYLNQAKAFELVSNHHQGLALAEKTLEIAQTEGLELEAGVCLELIGYNAYALGDYPRSRETYQRLVDFHERTGRLELPTRLAISILSQIALEQGHYERGLYYSQLFLERSEATDDRVNIAYAHDYLARAWAQLGDYGRSLTAATNCQVRAEILGDTLVRQRALIRKAYAHRQAGAADQAVAYAGEAVALARVASVPRLLANALVQLAEAQMALAQQQDDWEKAKANFVEAVTIFRTLARPITVFEAQIGLAELAYRQGELDLALGQIVPLMPHLPSVAADGWNEPIHAYVVCVQILRAAHDARAAGLLDQGLQLLASLAQNISDLAMRRNFLDAVPAHGQLRAL